MIDTSSERLLSLAQAAASLPTKPHIASLHRWRLRGIRGHRLETVLIGGRRFTSAEALERFIAATTRADNGGTASTPRRPPARTARQRQRDIERAERELERVGI